MKHLTSCLEITDSCLLDLTMILRRYYGTHHSCWTRNRCAVEALVIPTTASVTRQLNLSDVQLLSQRSWSLSNPDCLDYQLFCHFEQRTPRLNGSSLNIKKLKMGEDKREKCVHLLKFVLES